MSYKIAPYSHGSKSANVLKTALGALFLKKTGSEYTYKKGDVVINWGSPYGPKGMPCLNGDNNIVRDKLVFFKHVAAAGLSEFLPPFATTIGGAAVMKFPVMCRTETDGSDGSGLVVAKTKSDIVPAKLYTQYVKQTQEYRVHVGKVKGKAVIIHVQRKAKLNDSTYKETMVRTGGHGYILAHNNFTAPDVVLEAAKKVFMACNLDFGGCDVVYNEDLNRAFVLEINTAPELSGPSVEKYQDFFAGFHEDVSEGNGGIAGEVQNAAGSSASSQSAKNTGMESVLAAHGTPAVVSGGDIAGLMKQLEAEVNAKVEAAYIKGLKVGEAHAPKVDVDALKKAAFDEGVKTGEHAFKSKMKELFA